MCRISRAVRIAATLAAAFATAHPLTPALAADDEKPPARRPALQSVSARAPEPSEQQCRKWAARFERAVNKRDIASGSALFDWDALIETATAWPDIPPAAVKSRDEFVEGAKSTARAGIGFMGELLNVVRHGGSYKFLRCRDVAGRRRAEFRMTGGNGGLNYHEFLLALSHDGSVRAVDCYVFLVGELQSETLRQAFLPLAHSWAPGGMQQLTASEREFVALYPEVAAMLESCGKKEHRQVLEVYQRMPQSLKKMKLAFTMRLGSAQAIGVDERLRAADEYRQFYPNDASIDLIALDALLLRKSYNQALAGLDRIDTAVGGDPYLKVLRARILLKQDKPEAARKMAEAGIAEEPTLKAAYYFLVDQSLKQRNFAKSAELLSQLESRCNVKFMDLTTVPAYAEFVKSQEYKAWLKSRRGGK